MAYKKTAHRRRRVRSSRRKNTKSRKMMGGGGKFNSIPQCNAAINKNPTLRAELMQKTRNYTNPCPIIVNNYGGNY
jgi:hypothetical protein